MTTTLPRAVRLDTHHLITLDCTRPAREFRFYHCAMTMIETVFGTIGIISYIISLLYQNDGNFIGLNKSFTFVTSFAKIVKNVTYHNQFLLAIISTTTIIRRNLSSTISRIKQQNSPFSTHPICTVI